MNHKLPRRCDEFLTGDVMAIFIQGENSNKASKFNSSITTATLAALALALMACGESKDDNVAIDKEASTAKTEQASSGIKASTNEQLSIVDKVELAAKNNDFRLLATSGRSVSIPGLSAEDVEFGNKNCGIKLLPSMGDVIRSDEQRAQRKKTLEYMKSYNKEMIKRCKQG